MPKVSKKADQKSGKSGTNRGKQVRLDLFNNIQFIYELVLSKMELDSFDVDYKTSESMRFFEASRVKDKARLLKRSAYLAKVDGKPTDYSVITSRNRTKSVNQFLTHWIYPYKGKFHPQMIRAIMNIMGLERGDVVLDPFIGSGTTAVEAKLLGINSIGMDVSPVCVMISKAKTQAVDSLGKIEKEMEGVMEYARGTTLYTFDKPQSLATVIKGVRDRKAKNFFKVAELVAGSDSSRRRRKFGEAFVKNLDRMVGSLKDLDAVLKKLKVGYAYSDVREGDARKLDLDDDSMDGIITSPPYSIALDYVKNDEHALEALGLKPKTMRERFIGVRGKPKDKVELYNKDMAASYKEMYRVLKPDRYCAIVIGDATLNERPVETVKMTIRECKRFGFELEYNVEKIIFGLYNVMQKENILIFKKQ
jgi:ubiquinone/menaquinone biosynthesis C-methylase UbiE